VVQVAEAFLALLKDPAHFRENARAVKELEHEADKVTHAGLELLYSTFITPIDREDVHALITRLDDVADFIDAAAQRFVIYAVERVDEDLHAQAQVLVLSTERVRGGVGALRVMKKPGAIKQTLLDISKLENEGDQIFRGALAKLFASEKDPIRLIVRKELHEITEAAIDKCSSVGHVIEAIVLKHG
jgi:predicted phosphate transport protein (TIGR00153 family)